MRPGITLTTVALLLIASTSLHSDTWPQFRGTGAQGVADGQSLPTTWDVDTGENIRWTTEIPGSSHASPVVWNDRLFVLRDGAMRSGFSQLRLIVLVSIVAHGVSANCKRIRPAFSPEVLQKREVPAKPRPTS